MEENLRPNITLQSPDPATMAGGAGGGGGCCSSNSSGGDGGDGVSAELTRTSSDASSLTVDDLKRFAHHNANAIPLQHTEWTDEKHNLYLNFLEASFVEQLHHSRSLYGWGAPVCGSYSSQPLLVNTCSFGDEYMVQQNGCWQKVNFERNKRLLDSTADSHVILRRPQIQNFRAAGKSHAQTSYPHEDCLPCGEGIHLDGNPNNTLGSARSLEQQPGCRLCHQNLVGSAPEVSDQNFVDEDQGETSSTSAPAKRLKTVAADALSSDQVVPLGKVASMDILPVGHPSAENGQAQYEFLAEQSHNFVRPKSELHYFLRGS